MANLNKLLEGLEQRAKEKGPQREKQTAPKPGRRKEEVTSSRQAHKRFRIVSATDFVSLDLPPRELLMDPWLPSQGLAMIYAPRGIGKTFFALEIAYAVASGKCFLKWQAAKCVPVLYIDGEMCGPDLQDRVKKIYRRSGAADADHFKIMTPDLQRGAMPNLSDPDSQKDLNPMLEGVKLVIVDNISTLCRGGNENEADSWQTVQDWALRLRANGISVLFVHHAGKSGGQRGTSKREDVLDSVISLKRPADYETKEGARFEVHFEKSRGFTGPNAEPFEARLDQQAETELTVWEWSELTESTYDQAVKMAQAGRSQTEIATELTVNKSTVSRHLNRAKQEGLLT